MPRKRKPHKPEPRRSVWCPIVLYILCVVLIGLGLSHAFSQSLPFDGKTKGDWISSIQSDAGDRCCDEADGEGAPWRIVATDPTDTSLSGYEVFWNGEWLKVPARAVVHEHNWAGHAIL